MITLENLRTDQKSAILKLARQHGARNIRVFGSVVPGENRQDSDVDFLVDDAVCRLLSDDENSPYLPASRPRQLMNPHLLL